MKRYKVARSGSGLHVALYRSLYVLLAASAIGAALGSHSLHWWTAFKDGYFFVSLLFAWYFLFLVFWGERQRQQSRPYNDELIAVLIPMYNEEPRLLLGCLQSVKNCDGNKTVILLDDGSDNGLRRKELRELCERYGVHLLVFPKNRGKRHVVHDGVKALHRRYDYVVTIDSDTVLAKDALIKLVSAFQNPKVGAASGNVLLLNERKNLLTRMIGAYYWMGLGIRRQAQSTIGSVSCCSGCLAAYRGELMDDIIDEFLDQRFLGERCTFSEDRHLTNLIMRNGWQVRYVPDAISYTNTPDTIRKFLKQQQRWKRGFIWESCFTVMYAWRNHKALFVQVLICDLIMPFAMFGMLAELAVEAVRHPSIIYTVLVPYWFIFSMAHRAILVLRAPTKIPGMLMYVVFFDLVLYWQGIYALFTIKRNRWLTR
jgi:hyaluronan synthase